MFHAYVIISAEDDDQHWLKDLNPTMKPSLALLARNIPQSHCSSP